jgi:DNA-binding response OmpR family regulator
MAHIVVIEDDSTMLLNLLEVLEYENYAPHGARSGSEGLRLIESVLPDLVLCDIMLPDIDGFEMARRLRGHPATAHVPVIFISARTDSAPALEANIVDYLTKPFDVSALLASIQGALNGSQSGAGQHGD